MQHRRPTPAQMENAYVARYGREYYEKLKNTLVAVCGLGGLGSNVALYLARAGIGKLLLIDDDRVTLENLSRQYYKPEQIGMLKTEACRANILEYSPYCNIYAQDLKLTTENLPPALVHADIICEAFDDPRAKAMLVDGVSKNFPDKYIVATSGMAGLGTANRIQSHRVSRRLVLCGDATSAVGPDQDLYATRVMVCAAHQAHAVIRLLTEEMEYYE